MKTKSFLNVAVLFALSFSLLSCSPQTAIPLASTSTPTNQPTATPPPTATAQPSATPQPSPTVTPLPDTLALARTIKGDPNPLSMPSNLALDSKGDLYVLDGGNDRVQVYDPSGKFITMWGGPGVGNGQFDLLVHEDVTYTIGGIVLDKTDKVYIGDGQNLRLQVFDSRGNFLMKWGGFGVSDGQFLRVFDIAMDAQGYIYVVDDHSDDIQKFDPQGKFIIKFAEDGKGDGQLSNTGGITIGPDGNLYIADYGNDRVEVFSSDGKYLRQWPTPVSKPDDIAIDGKGNIFTTHEFGAIVEYDSNGSPISVMKDLGLDEPSGIVTAPNDLVYVADKAGIEVLQEK